MQPAHLAEAAALLESAPAQAAAQPQPAAVLKFLGLMDRAGNIGLPQDERRQFSRMLRMAARLDAVFPMRIPTAPGAAFFGARRIHGADGGLAGAGAARQSDYAGLADGLAQAFCACIGEAAEHDAMFLRRRDSRISAAGTLPLLDDALHAAGGIDAELILREAGDSPRPAPRSSTGYAAGPTLAQAAMSALLECIERHAVSLWFNRARRPVFMIAAGQTLQRIMRLRGEAAPPCQLLRLTHDIAGAPAAAAYSISAQGSLAVGYGCALSADEAALKAVRELCQGEFALYLETRASSAGAKPFTSRSRMFSQNADLFQTLHDDCGPDLGRQDLPSLCAALGRRVRFADLSLSENSVPVACALVDGLRDIASEFGPGQTGPL